MSQENVTKQPYSVQMVEYFNGVAPSPETYSHLFKMEQLLSQGHKFTYDEIYEWYCTLFPTQRGEGSHPWIENCTEKINEDRDIDIFFK
jgi:hypothetical protein